MRTSINAVIGTSSNQSRISAAATAQCPTGQPEPDRGSMKIFDKSAFANIPLYVEPTDTIGSVKMKAWVNDDIPPNIRHLMYFGNRELLEHDRTLSDYNIPPGSSLESVPHKMEVTTTK